VTTLEEFESILKTMSKHVDKSKIGSRIERNGELRGRGVLS